MIYFIFLNLLFFFICIVTFKYALLDYNTYFKGGKNKMKMKKSLCILIIFFMLVQIQATEIHSGKKDLPRAEPSLLLTYYKPLPFCVYVANSYVFDFLVTVIFGNIEMIAEVDPGGEVLQKVNFIIDGVTVASFDPHPSQMYYFNWTRDVEVPGGFFACSHYIELNVKIKNGEAEYGFPALRFF